MLSIFVSLVVPVSGGGSQPLPVRCPGIVAQRVSLPRGFLPVNRKPPSVSNVPDPEAWKAIQDLAGILPIPWSQIIPDYVYSNAVVRKGTPILRPLKRAGEWKRKTFFWHGTRPEAINGIVNDGPLLTSGWGEVRAGFFLDPTGLIAPTYQKKGGALIEVYVDPDAKTLVWADGLTRSLLEWMRSDEGKKVLADRTPEFFSTMEGDPARFPRDLLARSLGAQVLVNQTLYGQALFPDVVILDPTVLLGYRVRSQVTP